MIEQVSVFTVVAADGSEIASYPNVTRVSEEQHGMVTIYQLCSDGQQRHASITVPAGCKMETRKI